MKHTLSRLGVYPVLTMALAFYLLPIYMLVTTALKPWEDVHVRSCSSGSSR
jgi:ABC-type glycerol-3-phosphate transport system permease component